MAPKMDTSDAFPHSILGWVMNGTKYELLIKFLKRKSSTFQGSKLEDTFEFIIDWNERLHRIGIVKQHGIGFLTFLLDKDTKPWLRANVDCQSLAFPLLTWVHFHALFLKNYVGRALYIHKNDEFLSSKKGDMWVVAYVSKFYALSCYATQLLTSEEERICLYSKSLKYDLQILSVHMTSAGNIFPEVFCHDLIYKLRWNLLFLTNRYSKS